MIINKKNGIYAIYGGLFLGGGGGGSIEGGMEVLNDVLTYGDLPLHNITEFEDDDCIVTASLVGSPASKSKYVGAHHYKIVYDIFRNNFKKDICAIMTNEMGAQSITNGWMLSNITGIPLIDASCNGRAHPTGMMGSMGLSTVSDYVSMQAAAGGRDKDNIGIFVSGSLVNASSAVRNAATLAGGFVTVLRNPVTAAYVAKNAAINSISQAAQLGKIIFDNKDNIEIILNGLKKLVDLEIICRGTISECMLRIENGFDLGVIEVCSNERSCRIDFWNEYMTVEMGKERLATFPDLIVLFDVKTGLPLTSAEIVSGMEVVLAKVGREKLILGSSMHEKSLFEYAETVIHKEIVKYIFV